MIVRASVNFCILESNKGLVKYKSYSEFEMSIIAAKQVCPLSMNYTELDRLSNKCLIFGITEIEFGLSEPKAVKRDVADIGTHQPDVEASPPKISLIVIGTAAGFALTAGFALLLLIQHRKRRGNQTKPSDSFFLLKSIFIWIHSLKHNELRCNINFLIFQTTSMIRRRTREKLKCYQ